MFQYEIIVDHTESSNKCTILPLAYRDDFLIVRGQLERPFATTLLLHPDGIDLSQAKPNVTEVTGLGAIDCIWRRLEQILEKVPKPLPTLVRIPDGFLTAYPRRSKKDFDPSAGLATIEALFIAAAFVGHWDYTLLREYFLK
jgi:pre-rRNA-processing protein TSR3